MRGLDLLAPVARVCPLSEAHPLTCPLAIPMLEYPRNDREMTLATDFATDELIRVCIDRQIEGGEVVVGGIATSLVAAGYPLAGHTAVPILREWILRGILMVEGDLIGMRMPDGRSTPGVQGTPGVFCRNYRNEEVLNGRSEP